MCLTKEQLGVTKYIVTDRQLVANVVYEATRAYTLPRLPRNAEIIVEKVREVYHREFKRPHDNSEFHIRTFETYGELVNWIKEHIMTIPEIQDLNLTDSEVERGLTVDDVKDKFVFTSRYSDDPDPKDDFIDLGALARNLTHSLMRENIEINYSTF